MVLFSFPVCFSEAEIIPQAQEKESNTCCDSVAILLQIACLRDFKINSAVRAKKRLFFHFPDAANSFVKSLHPSLGQQG